MTSDPSEADSAELQEAVSKTIFKHEFNNLEPATTYSIYLKAYSALGGSQQSSTITATTLGGGTQKKNKKHNRRFLPHDSVRAGIQCPETWW